MIPWFYLLASFWGTCVCLTHRDEQSPGHRQCPAWGRWPHLHGEGTQKGSWRTPSPVVFRLRCRDILLIHRARRGGQSSEWRKSETNRCTYFHTCEQILQWGSESTEMYPGLCLVSFLLSVQVITEPLPVTVFGLFSKTIVVREAVRKHQHIPAL